MTKLIFSWLAASVTNCVYLLVNDLLNELFQIRIFFHKIDYSLQKVIEAISILKTEKVPVLFYKFLVEIMTFYVNTWV